MNDVRNESGVRRVSVGATTELVNRTRRVVRERAGALKVQRSRVRSLWVPLAVSFALLAVLAFAIWTAFEEYDASPAGVPDGSQMLALTMWCVPVSLMVLAVVWFRRGRAENESAR